MKVNQIINCSFDRWYHLFKDITIKRKYIYSTKYAFSEIIKIDEDVLEYLRDGSTIILPKSCQIELDNSLINNQNSEDSKNSFWEDDKKDDPINCPDFNDFDKNLKEVLEKFDNKVFVKLNWSSPKDAFWSINKRYCQTLSDFYIMLKSSDFISHDLNEPFNECEDFTKDHELIQNLRYTLVIREWTKINPSMEFRCFVKKHKLIGVSQRDCRTFYRILLENKNELLKRIEDFYESKIMGKFHDDSYVFDVALGKKAIKLIDFNPFGKITDSLLFSWDELSNDLNGDLLVDFRLVENDFGIQAQTSLYGQPIEFISNGLEGLNYLKTLNMTRSSDEDD